MRTTVKIALIIIVISGLAFWWQSRQQLKQLEFAYKQSAEEQLTELAVLLAQSVSLEFPDLANINQILELTKKYKFSKKIYNFNKSDVYLRVYITDKKGKVIFDSSNKALGLDYSNWNDVVLALRGQIGSRSTKEDEAKLYESTIYVAVPIIKDSTVLGVLSVGKPAGNINTLINSAYSSALEYLIITFLLIASISFLLIYFIISPISALTKYALDVRDGKTVNLPKFPKGEMFLLGDAFLQMKEALDGRKYVEKYIQTLTHEMKSPITAISGAAEILSEDISLDDQKKFTEVISKECKRLVKFTEDIMTHVSLQNNYTGSRNPININEIISKIRSDFDTQLDLKKISLESDISESFTIIGDLFLVQKAVSNIIGNAIDFSPENSKITIKTNVDNFYKIIEIQDNGLGIPKWAIEKVFDQFFSLPRPDTNQRSSGLGLSMVREIMKIHNGKIEIKNADNSGCIVSLFFPNSESSL